MIILHVTELLTPGITEVLGDEWEVATSYPGDGKWLEWDKVDAFVVQWEIVPPNLLATLSGIAPVVVIAATPSIAGYAMRMGAKRVVSSSSYADELFDAVDEAVSQKIATPTPGDEVHLSRREKEVLRLMADPAYLTFAEIAERMEVGSPGYVNNISHRLYDKLGVGGLGGWRCRTAAVERGRELGLI